MRSLAAPSQGSQTSVNNLPCAKKKKKENPHTHTQHSHSQKKGGFELHRMAEHLGPSSSVWNPRAEEQIKCGTAGEEQEGKFQTNICTCGGSRAGGAPKRFHVLDPQNEHTRLLFPCSHIFFKSAQAHVRAFYSSSSSYNYYYWCNFLNDTLHVKYIHHFLNTNKL